MHAHNLRYRRQLAAGGGGGKWVVNFFIFFYQTSGYQAPVYQGVMQ